MDEARAMPHIWSVTELTRAIRGSLEERFRSVDIEAEVSGYKLYPSGHAYFTLKDEESQLAAVFFKGARAKCPSADAIRDGVKIKVRGAISVGLNSKYQILVQRARLVGEGELMARYLALKAKLESEGLFDSSRKRPLPFLPRRIGIVTSPAGAVIHDLCQVLTRRFPALEIRLYPAVVQGDSAAASIMEGLDYFNDPDNPWRADLIIFGRGGGSYEDLFCFNDEALVRKVAASGIPTVSAVGHETDFTLCDFAADCRAGTPSMAAELAVPVLTELQSRLKGAKTVLVSTLRGRYEWYAQRLDKLSSALVPALQMKSQDVTRRLEALASTLVLSLQLKLVKTEARLAEARKSLELLSPYGVLERGYSLSTGPNGEVLRDAAALHAGDVVTTRLANGEFVSIVR